MSGINKTKESVKDRVDAEKKTQDKLDVKLLEQEYKYILLIYDQEKERRKTVESKASLFLTSNAIIGSLLAWSSRFLFEGSCLQKLVGSGVLLVLIGLLTLTIIYTLKVLNRATYNTLDENVGNDCQTEEDFYLKMISSAKYVIQMNQNTINRKVDWMRDALNLYKAFWIVLASFIGLFFLYSLFVIVFL